MSLLDPLPADLRDKTIVCSYVNATSKIQIARITDVPQWYFERVVFPGQNLIFEAISSAHVEIHTGMMASSILSDTIPCIQLQVEEVDSILPNWVPIKAAKDLEENDDPQIIINDSDLDSLKAIEDLPEAISPFPEVVS
ncbi:MAG: DUF1830 domain-containing protein [Pseudanabaenaceae cyanobacterium bins.39]|nr:DUF1830 domain-containing protein [Pseudanabaenaceae cyanobacterium bins.39]